MSAKKYRNTFVFVPDGEPTEQTISALDYFSKSGLPPNYLNWILCITFGMESITIGYNLAVSPIFIMTTFDRSTGVIGAMLAAGATIGTVISILVTLTTTGKALMRKYLPSPYNFFFALVGISISVFLAAVPSFPVHIVGLLCLMGFNDLAAILLNEMQGTVTSTEAYSVIGPMGQVIRRSFNVVTAITGPVLFSIMPQLPYIVAGSVTTIWTIFLVIIMMRRMEANRLTVLDGSIKPSQSLVGRFMAMSFASKEIIAQQKEAGMKLEGGRRFHSGSVKMMDASSKVEGRSLYCGSLKFDVPK